MNHAHVNNNRTVLYLRVSTKRQADKANNLPEQTRQCRDYCRSEGLEIVDEFVDPGESARSADRPEFQRMLSFCRSNNIGYIVVQRLDRFARNVADLAGLSAELFATHGIKIRSAHERVDESADGRFFAGISGLQAEHFSNKLSEQQVIRCRSAVERGLWPWRAPLGYVNVRAIPGQPNIVPDKDRAPLVARAFELMASGQYRRAEVLKIISTEGLTTKNGATLTQQTFSNMLRNSVYKGMTDSKTVAEHVGLHEPLVSTELFDAVQDVLTGRSRKHAPHRRANPEFPLKGIRCTLCSTKLTGSKSRSKTGKLHAYYHCPSCSAVRVRAEKLEGEFFYLLNKLNPRPEVAAAFPSVLSRIWNEKQADIEKHRAGISRQLDAARRLRDGLTEKYAEGKLSDEVYQRTAPGYEAKVTDLETELRTSEDSAADLEAFVRFGELLLLNMPALWQHADAEEKPRVRTLLFSDTLSCSKAGTISNSDKPTLFKVLEEMGSQNERMVRPERFELPTFCFVARRSIQLS
jgi:site-specific DNA recombinase